MKLSLLTFTLSFTVLPLLYGMTLDEQLLSAAAQTGNIQQAQEALNAGANINFKDALNITPLQAAIVNQKTDMVRFLLESHAQVTNSPWGLNNNSMPDLHYAVCVRNIDLVKLLINADGIDINARDNKDETPLDKAVKFDNSDVAKLLLDAGANIDIEKVKTYLPADTNNLTSFADIYSDFLAPDHSNNAQVLIKNYADLLEQIQVKPSKQLLTRALRLGYVHAVKLLLKAGITPDARDLALVKEKYNHDKRSVYKESYAAIGRILLQHLRLVGRLQVPQNSTSNSIITKWYHQIVDALWPTNTRIGVSAFGPISKSGLGLPENAAHNIASLTY